MAIGFLQVNVSRVVIGQAGYFVPIIGPLVQVITLVAYFFWGWGVFLLVSGLRREHLKLQRNRIGYVLTGAIIVMAGTATNFTALQPYPVDTACTLINALLVSYAVTRYRLLNTGTVLRRGLTAMGIVALGVGGYILFSFAADLLVRPSVPWQVSLSGLAGFIVLLILSLLLGWKLIRPFIDRLAGRQKASYDRVLEQFTQAVRSLLDVDKLKDLLVQTAADAVGTERGCLLFYDGEKGCYRVGSTYGSWEKEQLEFTLESSDEFIPALKDRKFPLWEQETLINPGLEYMRSLSEGLFSRTETSVVFPLTQEETVIGILCLGNRASDGMYGTEDLRFLSTLANVAASSIAVALNYREIERQLSIQTFLFVLSESLVRYAGSEEAIRSAMGVLRSFLGVGECFLFTFGKAREMKIYSLHDLSPRLEKRLGLVGQALLSGKGKLRDDAQFPGALDASPIGLPESDAESRLVRSLLYLPLTSGAEWIGILAFGRRDIGSGRGDSGALTRAFKAILSQGLLSIRHVSELSALKEYNEKVLVSVSTSGEMLLVMDSRGTILKANSAATDLLGFGEEELVGISLRQLVDRDSAGTAESFLRSAPVGVVQNCEMQFRTKSDRGVPVLVSRANIVDAENTTQEVVVLARDISRLRDAERGLEESEWRYRSLFENVLDAVVTFREDGEIVDVNPAGQGAVRDRRPGGRRGREPVPRLHARGKQFFGSRGRAGGPREHQGLRDASAQTPGRDEDCPLHRWRGREIHERPTRAARHPQGRHRAAGAAAAAPAGAENGKRRNAGRRNRARLQQYSHRNARLRASHPEGDRRQGGGAFPSADP